MSVSSWQFIIINNSNVQIALRQFKDRFGYLDQQFAQGF
jgi:hypothetical protein